MPLSCWHETVSDSALPEEQRGSGCCGYAGVQPTAALNRRLCLWCCQAAIRGSGGEGSSWTIFLLPEETRVEVMPVSHARGD